ncbi:DddA-like double-stranded DNA deaminase toxin [Lentzea sp. NBRC 102530]|uniref:DddA-like double-stranded DNA deaminase toxin n=1 Tax=Lentzea sp. NBRC 102530 TaxID=3032201 RepID=UPI002553C9E9|nr:DddA-like double-stranded DNA deaminase toxin [Lentzea sp. NBRC 102530]
MVAALRHVVADLPFAALADALELAEGAKALVERVAEGSGQDEFAQVIGSFDQAVDGIGELQERLTGIERSVVETANRLEGQGAKQDRTPRAEDAAGAQPQERLLSVLPEREEPGGKTTGFWLDQDGRVRGPVVSGRGPLRDQAVEGLRRLGLVSGKGTLTVADHVEVQIAVQTELSGEADTMLAVNNRPCDVGPFSCDRVVPRVLRPGQRLTVYWPGGVKSYIGKER